jgi:DNA modification methylase
MQIKPQSPVAELSPPTGDLDTLFDIALISALVGMSATFIRRVLGKPANTVSLAEVLCLLNQDSFQATFVPRSRIPAYLQQQHTRSLPSLVLENNHLAIQGDAHKLIPCLPSGSIQCCVTSPPYWAQRDYGVLPPTRWADGETSVLGYEQIPEAYIRHIIEILFLLKPAIATSGSVWLNIGDTYNTRTRIRPNASETLRAMGGHKRSRWTEYGFRRYSAGHAWLQDGESCLIPHRIAERASRLGYVVKGIITWAKIGSMPERGATTRCTRGSEILLHLAVQRTIHFDKSAYRLAADQGGRQPNESGKLTDVWMFSTSNGANGHGAQFPARLPARCIALTSKPGDWILDPFAGAQNTAIAAKALGRRSISFDLKGL